MEKLLWYLIAGTRGGELRGKIICLIKNKPCNAHEIAKKLKIDYKTSRHHLNVLEKNKIIEQIDKGNYGSVYFISDWLKYNMQKFEMIWERFG
ncbi:MAG: winged helix-turn-helix domain-containing protein [Nanoarchaeota archaeon]|nr:winged helix-turn-helix domain-containing protein [Nanoarchaeota archaeon]